MPGPPSFWAVRHHPVVFECARRVLRPNRTNRWLVRNAHFDRQLFASYNRVVQSWDVQEIEVPEGTRRAEALETVDGARAILIRLAPGEELGEHQVRERAWLMVVDGSARIEAGGDVVDAERGTLLTFEPDERHKVSSAGGTRIVMLLSSWPADGHYPNRPGDFLPST